MKLDNQTQDKKKPKSLAELMKSFADVISVHDFEKQFKLSDQHNQHQQNANTNTSSNNSSIPSNCNDNSFEISLVVVGHVDAGKSTLVGRLMGNIMSDLCREFEK